MRAAADSVIAIPTGVFTAVIATLGTVAVAWVTAHLARRSHGEDNLRDEVRAQRIELRLLSDYVLILRDALDEAGEDVPPWPDGLTR